jgi:hypothetical protein
MYSADDYGFYMHKGVKTYSKYEVMPLQVISVMLSGTITTNSLVRLIGQKNQQNHYQHYMRNARRPYVKNTTI